MLSAEYAPTIAGFSATHQPDRRRARTGRGERRVQVARPLASQVHRAQRMLESRVLGGREHPPCALQLVNAAESLQPGGINEVLLRRSSRHAARPALGDTQVAIDGVAGQVDARVLVWQYGHQ